MSRIAADLERLLALSAPHQLAEAEPEARRLLKEWGDCGAALKVLGLCLQQRDAHPEAAVVLRRAAALMEADAGAWSALGFSLYACGLARDSEAALRRAVALRPADGVAHNTLGLALKAQDRLAEAEIALRNALCVAPGLAEASLNLGHVLHARGDAGGAEAAIREAVRLRPGWHAAHNDLGALLLETPRAGEAAQCFERAAALAPDFAPAYNNLGNIRQSQGRLVEAAQLYQRALALDPRLSPAHSNLLFCHSHDERIGPDQLFAEHALFGERFEAPLRATWPAHDNERDPGRPLRVGFVSTDLRGHSMAYFIEPIFEYFAGSRSILVHAYSNSDAEDAVTERLRRYAVRWHKVTGDSDVRLVERIRGERIDILVDLNGHTGLNRLMAFARKPAPVQVSWIGYPGTTGLKGMDYYLADRHFLPPGKFDGQFTEKIVHLPAIVPFRPEEQAPMVSALPALANGYVTFGSFNRRSKIGAAEIEAWAALLRAVPGCRLLIGGLPQEHEQPELVGALLAQGITADRLSLHGRCGMMDYLQLQQRVDLCLDTFTYTGGTTTLHALWMGVPTLTIAGETAPRRQGAAIMGHLGLEDFVANDRADFVQRGRGIAGDHDRLAELRRDMRARFRRSAIGQPHLVAKGLEKALRHMWRRWCAGVAPEAFSVDGADG